MKHRLWIETVILCISLVILLSLTGCKSSEYQKAQELAENGDYKGAIAAYQELGDYKDSEERVSDLERKVIELKIDALINQYQSFHNTFGSLSLSNYETKMQPLEKIIDEFQQYVEEIDLSPYDDLKEYVQKVDACNEGIQGVIEIDRDSITQYYSPGFYMFPSSMAMSLSISEMTYNTMLKTLLDLEMPTATIEWLEVSPK